MSPQYDSKPFTTRESFWDNNRDRAARLRIAPATHRHPDGRRMPGVALFDGKFLVAAFTEEEAEQFANATIDALETARTHNINAAIRTAVNL